MKIAVCYSGLYRTHTGWLENHKENLPDADYYFSTWKSEESKVDIEDMNMIYFDDPQKTYNCYKVKEFGDTYGWHLKDKTDEQSRLFTGYFQHLAHWNVLQELKEKYDVVIRMRYDTYLGSHKDCFTELCQISKATKKSIGVGNSGRNDDSNKLMHFMKPTPAGAVKQRLLDFMTIHNQDDCLNVKELVDEEKMWPTNAGWWQILGSNGYLNYRGGIQLKRYT